MKRRDRVRWIWTSKDNTELAQRYDGWAAEYDADLQDVFGWSAPGEAAEVLSGLIPKASRVLDAGAGTGLAGLALADRGFTNLVAADLSIGMLEQAREKSVYRGFQRIVLGEPLPFAENAFDAVISVGVFTQGHAPASAFDELIRITRPGGPIVFTLKTDVHATGGFEEKQAALEKEGRWVLAAAGKPFQPLAKGEPDVFHRVWAYRVK